MKRLKLVFHRHMSRWGIVPQLHRPTWSGWVMAGKGILYRHCVVADCRHEQTQDLNR